MNSLSIKLAPFGEALRRDAETRVQAHPRETTPATVEELQFAVEELHIYEAELEIQNEELIESRTQIEQSHQKYFRHFDLAPVGLIRVNGAGLVVESNILGAQMLGVNRAQFYLGRRPFLAHVAPSSLGVFQQHFENAFNSGIPESCDLTLRNATGMETFVRMQSVRSRGEGKATELYVTLTDLTERRRVESELAARKLVDDAATVAAEAAKLAREQFFAMLTHELRTPLTPMLALLGEMEVTPGRSTHDCVALATMRRNLEIEMRLVDDLLDVTRVTSGKLKLQCEWTDVHLCLTQVVELCRGGLEEREHFLELELEAPRCSAHADGKRLQQVFWNLLGNSIKFTPPGGRIAIRTHNAAEHLVVEFQDTGVGIESAALERVFDPFMQANAGVPRRIGGLGLGLTIAQAITELHGGRLVVLSAGIGQGATFRFEIPVGEEPAPVPPLLTETAPPVARKNLRLLLVEDHDDTRHVLQLLLKRAGHTVATARDAATARKHCASQTFDLLITDLGLPDASGCELLHELGRAYGLRGIAMSGFDSDHDLAQSAAAGFVEHLVKPVDLKELDAAIQRAAETKMDTASPVPPDASFRGNSPAGLEEHFPSAYRFAFCLSLSPSRAAELTKTVFAAGARRMQTVADPARHRRALLTAIHRDWVAQGSRETALFEAEASTGNFPINVANAAQRDAAAVMTILHRMPVETRLILGLFYFGQLGYADIAPILGVPNETVIALLAAAKTSLRRQLEAQRHSSGVLRVTPNREAGE